MEGKILEFLVNLPNLFWGIILLLAIIILLILIFLPEKTRLFKKPWQKLFSPPRESKPKEKTGHHGK